MFLPLAPFCDAQSQRTVAKASTVRRTHLAPSRAVCHSPTASSQNIFAACSALQSLLTNTLPLSTATTITTSRPTSSALDSPIQFIAPSQKYPPKPQRKKRYPSQSPKARKSQHTPPPAPSRKRRRDYTPEPEYTEDKENNGGPATPNRKRRCPPSLPLGLAQEDFDALQPSHRPQEPHTPFQLLPQTTFVTPSHPAPWLEPHSPRGISHHRHRPQQQQQEEDETCPCTSTTTTSTDDSALVRVILDKLQLRQSDWDACAQKLEGRGKGSIGERFRVLVGDERGVVGPFRRGEGRLRRGSVQKMEFGEEIRRA